MKTSSRYFRVIIDFLLPDSDCYFFLFCFRRLHAVLHFSQVVVMLWISWGGDRSLRADMNWLLRIYMYTREGLGSWTDIGFSSSASGRYGLNDDDDDDDDDDADNDEGKEGYPFIIYPKSNFSSWLLSCLRFGFCPLISLVWLQEPSWWPSN